MLYFLSKQGGRKLDWSKLGGGRKSAHLFLIKLYLFYYFLDICTWTVSNLNCSMHWPIWQVAYIYIYIFFLNNSKLMKSMKRSLHVAKV